VWANPVRRWPRPLQSERLKVKLGAALIERDLLNEKIAILEANRPLARRRPRR
jgi:hypothetical protein